MEEEPAAFLGDDSGLVVGAGDGTDGVERVEERVLRLGLAVPDASDHFFLLSLPVFMDTDMT